MMPLTRDPGAPHCEEREPGGISFENWGSHLLALGEAELRWKKERLEREIREIRELSGPSSGGGKAKFDRTWAMDLMPSVISAEQWSTVALGLEQRLTALNFFVGDLYNEQFVVRDRVVPRSVFVSSKHYLPMCQGVRPKFSVWAHVAGSDLVRDPTGEFFVRKDQLRLPSGISTMLENRLLTECAFPELFDQRQIQPVDGYIGRLFELLVSLAPDEVSQPTIVVLTKGASESATFDQRYLSRHLGIPLVEGRDLHVESDDRVYMKTNHGSVPVDVIYCQASDDFIDAQAENPDSFWGCSGLFRAFLARKVALVNAPGASVAGEENVYPYVPTLIEYYLNEEPILRNVARPFGRPRSAPSPSSDGIASGQLFLRSFALSGSSHYVSCGGLARVVPGPMTIGSDFPDAGGTRDTWIVEPRGPN